MFFLPGQNSYPVSIHTCGHAQQLSRDCAAQAQLASFSSCCLLQWLGHGWPGTGGARTRTFSTSPSLNGTSRGQARRRRRRPVLLPTHGFRAASALLTAPTHATGLDATAAWRGWRVAHAVGCRWPTLSPSRMAAATACSAGSTLTGISRHRGSNDASIALCQKGNTVAGYV